MLGFSCSRFGFNNKSISLFVSNSQLSIFNSDSLLIIRYFSSKRSPNLSEQSFTISYLVNSCGLTQKCAESISERVYFGNPKKPDSILTLLRDNGFTNSHISKIIKERPQVLLASPRKSILPKLEFLSSVGVPKSVISNIVCRNPDILVQSIEKFLIPCYDILKSVLVSDDKVVKTLKFTRRITMHALMNEFSVNLSVLRGLGAREASISLILTTHPNVLCVKSDKFAQGIKTILGMGFDPSKHGFVLALDVFLRMKPKTWEDKMEVYKRFGFSEDEILLIFRKNPSSMMRSKKYIMNTMNFLVCGTQWHPADVVQFPVVLNFSLKSRIMPRCLVVKLLLLKGLIQADIALSTVLIPSDKRFLKRFVIKYHEQVPQLLDLYHGKIGLTELGFDTDDESGINFDVAF